MACVEGAWKQWAQERTKAREGDTRGAQPRPDPQGFSLKKWVGRPTHFLREKLWGRGWRAAPSPLACLRLVRPFFLAPTTSKRLLGIPIPKILVIWVSPSHITAAIWVRVGLGLYKGYRAYRGCPYH